MAIEKLRIGQKIFVIPLDREEQYISSVYDMDDKGIYVPIPFANSQPLILTREQEIQVKYMTENGGFMFRTQAIGRVNEKDKLPMYIFRYPLDTEITRFQLREFARVPIMLEVEYALPPEKDEPAVFEKVFTVDLSGGGIKLAIKKPFNRGQKLLLCFTIAYKAKKKQQVISTRGQVIRCELVDQDMGTYHIGIKFLDITPQQQDAIMAYVFERMIEIKRRK
ncbi:flagellar brake protein [Desulforamulus aquiferis]|uniref:PilZ domain-containing protein n=1 Tax=Desulforamulus aquiferis TaxID=1397668 RepID=A0AAW7ZGQ6_9FIRM|nr:flagellar brake domain-containing protein [Desulforamulus aquiferis]MDO7788384.1 PilZ domain-containing protein [Desulforamulus aquiferis]RYD03099.1 hypothetical protein N752_22060 [Desulforamulus aquiferis]